MVGDRRPRLEQSGLIRLRRSDSFPKRLRSLQRAIEQLVDQIRPDLACVEAPFHGASARAALLLAHARGVVLAVLAAAGVEVVEYAPAAVKKAVTGNGRADKEQVAAMVFKQVGEDLRAHPHDLSDALAVALCHLSHSGFSAAVKLATQDRARKTTKTR